MAIKETASAKNNNFVGVLEQNRDTLLMEWIAEQREVVRRLGISENQLKDECREFLKLFLSIVKSSSDDYAPVESFLTDMSRTRSERGASPSDTATFIFSFKKPLLRLLGKDVKNAETLASEVWMVTETLDRLGLFTVETYQKAREGIIRRQQQEMLELSTPVVTLAEGILALPLIGTLDSARTQVVMESLLQAIVETGSTVAIIDITGVPTVDTLVAQHLLKTVTAARLMGADCIISGIRPQIAQTIVHLGVELGNVITKATLADAFKTALKQQGMFIARNAAALVKAGV